MSEAQSYPHAFEAYNNEFVKQQSGFDLFSFHSPSDIIAPHPDAFESDIDSNLQLAAYSDQLQLLTVDSYDAYFFRSEKPQWQGPLSAITVSSDAYESLSSHSESFYNEQIQPLDPAPVDNTQLFDFQQLGMDFQGVRLGSEYSAVQSSLGIAEDVNDPSSFGTLPPTPPHSPPVSMNSGKHFDKSYMARSTYSDYMPHQRRSSTTSSDYYSSPSYSPSHPTVSPIHISNPLPAVATVAPQPVEEYKGDLRKKYKCSSCPRGMHISLRTAVAFADCFLF